MCVITTRADHLFRDNKQLSSPPSSSIKHRISLSFLLLSTIISCIRSGNEARQKLDRMVHRVVVVVVVVFLSQTLSEEVLVSDNRSQHSGVEKKKEKKKRENNDQL